MKTSIFKRSMALFLAFLLCFTTFIGSAVTPAFASAAQSEVCVISFPREGDANYNATWGHGDLNFMGGWHDKATRFLSIHAVGSFTGEICYCIEPGVNALIGDKVTQQDESFWDNYPSNDAPTEAAAMRHDLMRGLKQGKPFALMEQTPSVTNWLSYNMLKRPGVMRLWSYQAMAHGADTIMFFQMKRSIGACEKYHGAVIDHAGHENTRVFREVAQLGAELDLLGDQTLGARCDASVAILFDWDNWWGISCSAGPSVYLDYCNEVQRYYKALYDLNIPVDMIGVEDDLSGYGLVIAPVLYMVKTGYDEKIRAFVKNGGRFLTTFFSGYVDEHDLVTVGGYPGRLRDILGIWVEEEDALPEDMQNHFHYQGRTYPASMLCDLLHTEGADALAFYEEDFYAGMPVLTKNAFGKGFGYYVATRSSDEFYRNYLGEICKEAGISPIMDTPDGVEVTRRVNQNGTFVFLLNHREDTFVTALSFAGTDLLSGKSYETGDALTLEKKDVAILKI